jgi:hypothetical protein
MATNTGRPTRTPGLAEEHPREGRNARFATCLDCGSKPLIVRQCGRDRTCAVCEQCGFHHRINISSQPPQGDERDG